MNIDQEIQRQYTFIEEEKQRLVEMKHVYEHEMMQLQNEHRQIKEWLQYEDVKDDDIYVRRTFDRYREIKSDIDMLKKEYRTSRDTLLQSIQNRLVHIQTLTQLGHNNNNVIENKHDELSQRVTDHAFYTSNAKSSRYTLSDCTSKEDPITGETLTDDDVVYFVYVSASGQRSVNCYDRISLFEWFDRQPKLCIWEDDGRKQVQPIRRIYSLPDGTRLSERSVSVIEDSTSNVFELSALGSRMIGNVQGTHGVSEMHGQLYTIYDLLVNE